MDLQINTFEPCQRCSICCNTPCDIIPSDLPRLLKHFDMDIEKFFKQYLIALLIATPMRSDEILMMVPVRLDESGNRIRKYLADNEYLKTKGKCVFNKNNFCTINDIKPFGGNFLNCSKMTGSVELFLEKKYYFTYWYNNQHLFEIIFPGYESIYSELADIADELNKDGENRKLQKARHNIITKKLFPLFNDSLPIYGYGILT